MRWKKPVIRTLGKGRVHRDVSKHNLEHFKDKENLELVTGLDNQVEAKEQQPRPQTPLLDRDTDVEYTDGDSTQGLDPDSRGFDGPSFSLLRGPKLWS